MAHRVDSLLPGTAGLHLYGAGEQHRTRPVDRRRKRRVCDRRHRFGFSSGATVRRIVGTPAGQTTIVLGPSVEEQASKRCRWLTRGGALACAAWARPHYDLSLDDLRSETLWTLSDGSLVPTLMTTSRCSTSASPLSL